MFLVRIAKGDASPLASILTSLGLVVLYLGITQVYFPSGDPFHQKVKTLIAILILVYSSFGVSRCAGNADYAIVKWLAYLWAILLAALLVLYMLNFVGLLFGLIGVAALVGVWCNLD